MSPVAPAGPADAAVLAAIHAEAFARPWDAAAIDALLRASGAAAFRAGADGFVLVRRVCDEAEVLTLAVRPAARRAGVARALLEAAAAHLAAAGVHWLHLEVADDNAAALALYGGAGFARSGVRRGYYARGAGLAPADALILARRLNTSAA